jgi:hypothetical protein
LFMFFGTSAKMSSAIAVDPTVIADAISAEVAKSFFTSSSLVENRRSAGRV